LEFCLNLSEVKALFSEIVDNCPGLEGVHFMIAPSITPHSIVEGYEIHMSGKKIDDSAIAYLNKLANASQLSFEQHNTSAAIFKLKKSFKT
jgi:hypothetical protein